jgi:hypothetical protein
LIHDGNDLSWSLGRRWTKGGHGPGSHQSAIASRDNLSTLPAGALTGRCESATTGDVTCIIDSDQHLYERRSLWADYIDPSARHEALSLVDDDLGYTWLSWRDTRLRLADVHLPGDTASWR